jgi:hypothetical protein
MGGHLRALGLLQLQLGLKARSLALVRVPFLAHRPQPKHKHNSRRNRTGGGGGECFVYGSARISYDIALLDPDSDPRRNLQKMMLAETPSGT